VSFKVDRHRKPAEVKGVGAIVEDEEAVVDRCIVCPKIEELIDGGTIRFGGMGRLRLICVAVWVADEMDGGVVHFEIAKEDAGAEKAQDADAGAEAIDGGVRGFAGGFSAVEDDTAGFGIEAE
jgi:hypothetical protein